MTAENGRNIKKYFILILVILFLGVGFFIYYFPFFQKSVSVLAPELREEVNIVLIGVNDQKQANEEDDQQNDLEQEVVVQSEADAVVLARLEPEIPRVTFVNIPSRIENNGKPIKEMDKEQIINEISRMTGVEPPYYFLLSYEGFKNTINELNGIEVNLDSSLEVPDLGLYLDEGSNLLSGKEALNYVRWYDPREDEIDRIKRQQQVMSSFISKAFRTNSLVNLTSLYKTLVESYRSVETDLDRELVVELIEFLRERDSIDVQYRIYGPENIGEIKGGTEKNEIE